MNTTVAARYTAFAIVLHWAIAFAILFNLVLGFWMHINAEHGGANQAVFQAFQLHKSVGLAVLALSLVRLGWRLTHRPPPFPPHMPGWEKAAALAVHWAFYFIIIAMPLSGWLYVSAGWSHEQGRPFSVPTMFFGLFRVPHLFGLAEQGDIARQATADAAFTAHYLMAYAAIALALLHVAAALKHHFFDRDEVLAHMVPGLKAPFESARPAYDQGRLFVLGAGLGLTAAAAVALMSAALTLGGGTPASAPVTSVAAAPSPQSATAAPAPASAAPAPIAAPPSSAGGPPPAWRVDQSASAIRFSGTHAGAAFHGAFSRWSADIRFDPNNLDASSAHVTIQTGSAADGVPIHEQSMPTAEWFDAANHPTAAFRSSSFSRDGDRYRARGTLTIKGHPISVTLPFTLTINGDHAVMDGHVSISRREADLGMESDPDAEWVSPAIDVDVHVEAARAP